MKPMSNENPQLLKDTSPFLYNGFEVKGSELSCNYQIQDYDFCEKFIIEGDWSNSRAREAARIIYLLAGISYYKAFAPMQIDLGMTPIRYGETDFLLKYYQGGLGEFSYVNNLSLQNMVISGGIQAEDPELSKKPEVEKPLIPFGGGIDSIVTVELVKEKYENSNLFIMSPGDTKFEPIEQAAKITGLNILRAQRILDPQILKSKEHGFLNGHVPVTGILSAVAIATAILNDRTTVLMSNERSASVGNLIYDGRMINHQFSKSIEYENLFRDVLKNSFGQCPDWFSYLRDKSELWISEKFSEFKQYHQVFRSCNRAFHINVESRADNWCGECDKCCFIDLILSPYMSADDLNEMFEGNEPLNNSKLEDVFISLVSTSPDFNKPFECVGDIGECRSAVILASQRPDRKNNLILKKLLELDESNPVDTDKFAVENNISESYVTDKIMG